MPVKWFEVNPDTISLTPRSVTAWPKEMPPATRMQEECYESVIALNLPALFPGEDLLFIRTQEQLSPETDVLAVDPLGWVRLMELKKDNKPLTGNFWNQVLAYGLKEVGRNKDFLQIELGDSLASLPEQVGKYIEGISRDARVKTQGKSLLKWSGFISDAEWQKANRFRRDQLLVDVLRMQRGAVPVTLGPDFHPFQAICDRIYRTRLSAADLSDLHSGVKKILANWKGHALRAGAEVTVIAPEVIRAENIPPILELEKRGATFHLIDADLRCVMLENLCTRILLRWEPGHRTIPTQYHQFAVKVCQRLMDLNPDASRFTWSLPWNRRRMIWPGFVNGFCMQFEEETGTIRTQAEWLTEGLESVKKPRRQRLEAMAADLRQYGVTPYENSSELKAPWGQGDMEPAARLIGAYHSLGIELGVDRPHAWSKRPAM